MLVRLLHICSLCSQSYSCWYCVLSSLKERDAVSLSGSQSYSCWYWVLSESENVRTYKGGVSILFLLVLGSVSGVTNGLLTMITSLNPILAGTGFCLVSMISSDSTIYGLNPILAATVFCQTHLYFCVSYKHDLQLIFL